MDFYGGCTARRLSVGRRVGAVAFFAVITCALPAHARKRSAEVGVESNPPGALVSVHTSGDTGLDGGMVVAGETPLTKTFRFPKKQNLWLRLEKPGFEPQVLEIEPGTSRVNVELAPLESEVIETEPILVLAVVRPDLTVVRRGFAKEREDAAAGEAAAEIIARVLASRLEGRVAIVAIDEKGARLSFMPMFSPTGISIRRQASTMAQWRVG